MKFLEKRIYNESGSGLRPTFKLMYSGKTNALELKQTGVEDFQAYIESFAAGCDLNVIINKIRNGDVGQLNQTTGIYGDFTQMPQTLAEVLQIRLDAENMYNNLPDDVRSGFNGIEEFTQEAGSIDWLKKLGVKFEEPKEVEKNEQE